jgi:hypothetical protein
LLSRAFRASIASRAERLSAGKAGPVRVEWQPYPISARPGRLTWGELRRNAEAGDPEAQDALREYTAESAELIADGYAASRHAQRELEEQIDAADAARAAIARRTNRRERAMLAMTAASVLAAIAAACAAILH